jgi:PAS domain S-box-containing protein
MAAEPKFGVSSVAEPREAVIGVESASAVSAVPDDLRALREVVEGTAGGIGQEFFRSLVRHLAEAIDVHYVGVAEFTGPQSARVLAFWDRDHLVVEGQEFDLTTTPAGEVLRSGLAHFPTGVSHRFAQHAFLTERSVDSYMSVPFSDHGGRALGLLSVFDERPMPEEPRRLFILRIFAARAAAEFERLRAEQRLQDSEARYRDLYENAPNAYLVVGTDGRVISANRRLAELLGYPVEELVGALIHSFLPDTPAGKARSLEVHHKHLAGEAVSGWPLEFRRKDGRPLWVNVFMEPSRGADGTVGASRSFFVDVTAQVLAEHERARLQEQNLYLQEEIKSVHNFEQIIGSSQALVEVLENVGRVAPTDASVLVTGETGTGKELIARAIHSNSKRRDKPLIKVNCAALPAGLVESELFGHEKGAFSGAIAKRLGRFELANGGTIFLDEIGELPGEAQVKLLRVLQEREFDRVGGGAPICVDVRIIAATNRDLFKEVQDKAFREDLYYRLNVFPVRLPPLRERKQDIPLLVHFLINKFGQRIGKQLDGVSKRTMEHLQEYPWPGNIRELENVLERAVILAAGPMLDIAPDLLPTPAPVPSSEGRPTPTRSPGASPASEGSMKRDDLESKPSRATIQPIAGQPLAPLDTVERDYIATVLQHTKWVITGPRGAAKILGLNPSTLRSRIKKLGITRSSA